MVETQNNKLSLSLDLRIICLVLLTVVVAMLALWRPWQAEASDDRTVKVTGEAIIKAEPDEFVFYPTYEFKGANRETQQKALTTKSNELVAKIKELGIADSKIKTNVSNYDYKYIPSESGNEEPVYTLQLTVTAGSREEAQKIQDYLATTTPSGQISPQASFSEAKRKQIESEARDQATKDAKSKADQSAKNLGFNVGKVKSVEDGAGFQDIFAMPALDSTGSREASDQSKLSVQPGENELRYSVSVVYFLK